MPVRFVSNTRIFARAERDGGQVLVYQMRFQADEDLAMILPLPVPPGSGESAVTFVDLSGYPHLFDDLDRAFPVVYGAMPKGGLLARAAPAPQARLVVHDVGEFEASFVPSRADLGRLDPRFRLPDSTWKHLGRYDDWGFAVFKLRSPKRGFFARLFGGETPARGVHPMAFRFPRRAGSPLFFPTVHVHDGEVHPEADFSHTLFAQIVGEPPPAKTNEATEAPWESATERASAVVDLARAKGLVDPGARLVRRVLMGRLPNQDTTLDAI